MCLNRGKSFVDEFQIVPPTDSEIEVAERKLGFDFSDEYKDFLKSGYDLGKIPMEALEIVNPPSYINIYHTLEDAREYHDLPEDLLPICEDNGDLYCLTDLGEVLFWSHNGKVNEKWKNVKVWRDAMIKEYED